MATVPMLFSSKRSEFALQVSSVGCSGFCFLFCFLFCGVLFVLCVCLVLCGEVFLGN